MCGYYCIAFIDQFQLLISVVDKMLISVVDKMSHLGKCKSFSDVSDHNANVQPSIYFQAVVTRNTTSVQSKTSVNASTYDELHNLRLSNPNRLIIAQININSIRNKFDLLISKYSWKH